MNRLEAIRALGVVVNHEQEYYGPVPRQHRDREDTVRSIFIGDVVTSDEWVRATQREGDDYIGPCCGNTGYCQDVLASVYRDGGLIKNGDLLGIGVNLSGHDGYEEFRDPSDEAFAKLVETWKASLALGPPPEGHYVAFGVWEKILTCYRALEPMLMYDNLETPGPTIRRDDDEYAETDLQLLRDALEYSSWHLLFTPTEEERDDHHIQYIEMLSRIKPLAASLYDQLVNQRTALDGFALVVPGTDRVLSNRRGLCIYATRERAEYVSEIMDRVRNEAEEREHGRPEEVVLPEVVPMRVSVDGGLEVQR